VFNASEFHDMLDFYMEKHDRRERTERIDFLKNLYRDFIVPVTHMNHSINSKAMERGVRRSAKSQHAAQALTP